MLREKNDLGTKFGNITFRTDDVNSIQKSIEKVLTVKERLPSPWLKYSNLSYDNPDNFIGENRYFIGKFKNGWVTLLNTNFTADEVDE